MQHEGSAAAPGTAGADGRPRPRLLFLSQTLPFPPDGGAHIRTYNIMRLLARAFEIDALCFYRAATRPTEAAVRRSIEGLAPVARAEAFPIAHDGGALRLLRDHLGSVARRRVYTRYVYDSAEFRGALRRLLSTRRYDLVHVDSLDLAGYMDELEGLPVVCTHHNVESSLLRRRAATERFPRGAYMRVQANLMEAEERRWGGAVDLNVTVSEADRRLLLDLAPGADVMVVPNGVDTRFFHPAADGDAGLVFVGGYSWYPNRDALHYFVESVLPLLRRTHPDVPVTWVGDCPAALQVSMKKDHGVTLTGYVDDVRPYIERATCYVVPLRVGGGTRLKILDAWAMGKPLVSTSIGCEGLAARDGENILVRDDPAAFVAGVAALLDDAALRRRIAAGARATAEQVYDWDVIGDAMIARYLEVARMAPPALAGVAARA